MTTNHSTPDAQVELAAIQAELRESEIDGWLLYDFRGQNPVALHIAGLEESGTRRWFLWIPAEGEPEWLIHAIEGNTFVDVRPQMRGKIKHYVGWQELAESILALLGNRRGLKIAMEYSPSNAVPYVSKLDAGTKEMIEDATDAVIVSSADLVQQVQAVLGNEQIASHRRAAACCLSAKDAAFQYVSDALRVSKTITEYDVQQFILAEFKEGGLDPDHAPLVAVNGNAALPHYSPSAERFTQIQRGDILLIDLWARESNSPLDCFADITWTAFCGEKVPKLVQQVFQVVRDGRDAAIDFIQQRLDQNQIAYGYEVDTACRDVIENAGYGAYVLHRTGHSLGPAVHFNGVNIDNLETQDRRSLIPGVMFTIEPGIYMPDANFDQSSRAKGLGIRSEVNCYMHQDRVEVTTDRQMEMICLLA